MILGWFVLQVNFKQLFVSFTINYYTIPTLYFMVTPLFSVSHHLILRESQYSRKKRIKNKHHPYNGPYDVSGFGIKLKMHPPKKHPFHSKLQACTRLSFVYSVSHSNSFYFDGLLVAFNFKGHKNDKEDNKEWFNPHLQ